MNIKIKLEDFQKVKVELVKQKGNGWQQKSY